ncbi:MAG TPA: class I SAM-dependent methyltransferase [Phenylobacterium sp.]
MEQLAVDGQVGVAARDGRPQAAFRREAPVSSRRFLEEVERMADDGRQGLRYLRHQYVRFYETYRFILRHYGVPRRLASFGAGGAYLEAALASLHGVEVLVFDFPAALEQHRAVYEQFGFRAVAVDLTKESQALGRLGQVDLILCAEIVEHLPVPPSVQFADNLQRLGADVPMVVTTPNASSLRHLMKLLFMQPLLPAPELTFGEVCFENEGVHRREYVPAELRRALQAVGHHVLGLDYCWYHRPERPAEYVLYPIETLIGRFRPCMIVGSRPDAMGRPCGPGVAPVSRAA